MVELATVIKRVWKFECFTEYNLGQAKTEDAGHGWEGVGRSFLNDKNRYVFSRFTWIIVVFIFFDYIRFVVLHDLYSIKTINDRYLIHSIESISIIHDCLYLFTHVNYVFIFTKTQKKILTHFIYIFVLFSK